MDSRLSRYFATPEAENTSHIAHITHCSKHVHEDRWLRRISVLRLVRRAVADISQWPLSTTEPGECGSNQHTRFKVAMVAR